MKYASGLKAQKNANKIGSRLQFSDDVDGEAGKRPLGHSLTHTLNTIAHPKLYFIIAKRHANVYNNNTLPLVCPLRAAPPCYFIVCFII